MSNKKMYWKGYEELEQDPAFVANREKEFPGEVPMDEFLGDGEALMPRQPTGVTS